jgi:hypothetical protein
MKKKQFAESEDCEKKAYLHGFFPIACCMNHCFSSFFYYYSCLVGVSKKNKRYLVNHPIIL